jgi:hypothetical protein
MLYLSNSDAYAWYASFTRKEHWKVDDAFQITRRALELFEERGRQMELAQAQGMAMTPDPAPPM